MLNLVSSLKESTQEIQSALDEIVHKGAVKMLQAALEKEVADYIERHKSETDENGHRQVVRNGKSKSRSVTLSSGTAEVQAPRVNDKRKGEKFESSILPPYVRRSPKVESLLPVLYLKGLSTNDFKEALTEFLGEGASGLSSSSIASLKKQWRQEFEQWKRQKITKRYAYIWADGVNVQVRLGEDKKLCLLVVMGADEQGQKDILAVQAGYRESKDSWLEVLRDLKQRGLQQPLLAIADGALGFWAALRECDGFQKTPEQRCWVHKIANVLDRLPQRLQRDAKKHLHEMMRAESYQSSKEAFHEFKKVYEAKYPKVVECLEKDWTELTAFYSFPARHWQHIRSTNPIESSFATIKLRTRITKGAGNTDVAETMAYKLLTECKKGWRRLRGFRDIGKLFQGIEYKDGVMIPETSNQEVAVS